MYGITYNIIYIPGSFRASDASNGSGPDSFADRPRRMWQQLNSSLNIDRNSRDRVELRVPACA